MKYIYTLILSFAILTSANAKAAAADAAGADQNPGAASQVASDKPVCLDGSCYKHENDAPLNNTSCQRTTKAYAKCVLPVGKALPGPTGKSGSAQGTN